MTFEEVVKVMRSPNGTCETRQEAINFIRDNLRDLPPLEADIDKQVPGLTEHTYPICSCGGRRLVYPPDYRPHFVAGEEVTISPQKAVALRLEGGITSFLKLAVNKEKLAVVRMVRPPQSDVVSTDPTRRWSMKEVSEMVTSGEVVPYRIWKAPDRKLSKFVPLLRFERVTDSLEVTFILDRAIQVLDETLPVPSPHSCAQSEQESIF
jgi:hypothetical protein